MSIYAVVESGIVTNMVISDTPLKSNWILADNTPAYIGGEYDGSKFSAIPTVEVVVTEEDERQWRDSEMDIVIPLINEVNHPYSAELNLYMQELRDYPNQDGFPNNPRPTRPLTPSGSDIIR